MRYYNYFANVRQKIIFNSEMRDVTANLLEIVIGIYLY